MGVFQPHQLRICSTIAYRATPGGSFDRQREKFKHPPNSAAARSAEPFDPYSSQRDAVRRRWLANLAIARAERPHPGLKATAGFQILEL